MPELPEMQALAERLDEALAGAELERITPIQFSAAKTFDSESRLVGREEARRASAGARSTWSSISAARAY